jgi:nucleoside 2-deoxyribosyltransferase-like protein
VTDGRPFVFVVMPFSAEWDEHYAHGIKPACEAAGADCERVDKQLFKKTILEQIYAEIARADVVVAEMSGRNANVFYEAGYAHGIRKPVVFMTTDGDDIPHDLTQYKHIVHGGDVDVVRTELEEYVRFYLEHPEEGASGEPLLDVLDVQITGYMHRKDVREIRFAIVREFVNPAATDEVLERLIDDRPQRFYRVRVKGEPGIGIQG